MVANTGLKKIPTLLCQVNNVYLYIQQKWNNFLKANMSFFVQIFTFLKGFHSTKFYPNYLWILLDVDNQGYVPPMAVMNCSASQTTHAFNKTLLLTTRVRQYQLTLVFNVNCSLGFNLSAHNGWWNAFIFGGCSVGTCQGTQFVEFLHDGRQHHRYKQHQRMWFDRRGCHNQVGIQKGLHWVDCDGRSHLGFIISTKYVTIDCNEYQGGEFQLFDGNGNLAQQSTTVIKQFRGYKQWHTPHGCYASGRKMHFLPMLINNE